MTEIIASIEVCVLLGVFIILGITSFVFMVMSKVSEIRKEKEEKGTWADFFNLRSEFNDLKRQVEKMQER